MFGRVRASPPPYQESELHSSKLIKQDSFSVYECTLLKLKLGSQQSPCSPLEISLANVGSSPDPFPTCMDIDSTPRCFLNFRKDFNPGEASPATTADSPTPVSLEQPTTTTADSPTPVSLEQPTTTTCSILYLFSKYKASHRHFSADETSKPDS